jgi:hypothetical protein
VTARASRVTIDYQGGTYSALVARVPLGHGRWIGAFLVWFRATARGWFGGQLPTNRRGRHAGKSSWKAMTYKGAWGFAAATEFAATMMLGQWTYHLIYGDWRPPFWEYLINGCIGAFVVAGTVTGRLNRLDKRRARRVPDPAARGGVRQ